MIRKIVREAQKIKPRCKACYPCPMEVVGCDSDSRPHGHGSSKRCPECMPMPGMGDLKAKKFVDIEGKASGMIIAPMMALLISMLRQMPKSEAQEFCRHASLSFARIAMTGDIKL